MKDFIDFAAKRLKNTIMSDQQKSERSKHADTVIRNHIIWSMGASFIIPIPIADIFAVAALQLDMIRQLCRVYGQDFSETQGKAIVTSLTSSTFARAGARSLIKLVPGLGTVIGGVAVSVFNGASTYALGEVFKRHFETGGTILDFDTDRLKKMYREKFEKGKKVAEELRRDKKAQKEADEVAKARKEKGDIPTPPAPAAEEPGPDKGREDVLVKLRELGDLRSQGIISEEEFQDMKQKLIEQF